MRLAVNILKDIDGSHGFGNWFLIVIRVEYCTEVAFVTKRRLIFVKFTSDSGHARYLSLS